LLKPPTSGTLKREYCNEEGSFRGACFYFGEFQRCPTTLHWVPQARELTGG